ncbi:hypothetical protein TIFTF001_024076 [Ficus carica]|uniref:Uncharacterized protein n=1 Tax=Ficus carica TaxID=3494 RepID=A0AA88DD13_FICCA|nr:hypothetical protein TIFTF001_024076 [Ficus carica]
MCRRRYCELRWEVEHLNNQVLNGDSVLQVLLYHRNDLVREDLPSLDRVRFSAIGVVTGSYGVLERVSF